MAKQPYIPLYIGDWEKDTNCLTPMAEFALLKLTFKLFNAEKRGVFEANFRTLSVLFKCSLDETKEIFKELIENKILDISDIQDGKFCIKSRRMLRETEISEKRATSGRKGGESKTKAKPKQTKSKSEAKQQQNPDNDIDNNNVINEAVYKKIIGVENSDFDEILDEYCESLTENIKTDPEEIIPSINMAIEHLSEMSYWRTVVEHHKISETERLDYFKIFYEQNQDSYLVRYPTWLDMAKHFYNWVPVYKAKNRPIATLGKGPTVVIEAGQIEIKRMPRI